MKFMCGFILLIALSCQSPAQQPTATASVAKSIQAPSPLILPAPEFSQWTITCQYGDDEKPGQNVAPKPRLSDHRPRKIVTIKTKAIIHEMQTDGTGQILDTWHDGKIQFVKHPNESIWFQIDNELNHGHSFDYDYNPLPPSGFRGMELVSAGNFAGTVTVGEARCLVFVPGGVDKIDLSDIRNQKDALAAMNEIVYINADTHLPVATRSHGETRTFSFGIPPSELQVLPGDLTDQITKGEEARKRLQQPAPRPY